MDQNKEQVGGTRDLAEEDITQAVLTTFKNSSSERFQHIMQSLVQHLHVFVKDVKLTEEEWFKAIDYLTRTGHITDGDISPCHEGQGLLILTNERSCFAGRRRNALKPIAVLLCLHRHIPFPEPQGRFSIGNSSLAWFLREANEREWYMVHDARVFTQGND